MSKFWKQKQEKELIWFTVLQCNAIIAASSLRYRQKRMCVCVWCESMLATNAFTMSKLRAKKQKQRHNFEMWAICLHICFGSILWYINSMVKDVKPKKRLHWAVLKIKHAQMRTAWYLCLCLCARLYAFSGAIFRARTIFNRL